MQNSSTKSNGTTFNVSNGPGTNGATDWENFGNLFLDSSGRRGTFYFSASVAQLEALLAQAKASQDGKVSRKVAVFPRKPKSSSSQQPAAAPAA